MPIRKIPLVSGEIYHVINRGVNHVPIFLNSQDYRRMMNTFCYYQNIDPPVKYSYYMQMANKKRSELLSELLIKNNFRVDILSYCLMANHFHFLLRQLQDNGIRDFIQNICLSYSKFFNTKHSRTGPLFDGRFKAKRIETDEQLVHVSRYIHLNPYASYIVKTFDDCIDYPYSSLSEYLGKNISNICQKDVILGQYKNSESYRKFIEDQKDYQRRLETIKHLVLE